MILIIAEHNNKALHPATRHAVTAALQLGSDVHVLVAGHHCEEVAKQASTLEGVSKIVWCDDAAYAWPLAENIAPLAAPLASHYGYVLATATTTGKDILPRLAALLDVSQVSEVVKILSPDTFVRPIYAGNALATVQSHEKIKVITLRQTAFSAAAFGNAHAPIEKIPALPASDLASFVEVQESKTERPELTSARVVVSGGRGVGSKENFVHIEALADSLQAAVGASRAAVDAGFVPNDYQVGQTGKVVAPDLYIAVGISGAIQHLAGMKDSKVIVAINKDENAPIFEVADYGLVAEWQTAIPELLAQLKH